MNDKNLAVRHLLATLAYRFKVVIHWMPESFADYRSKYDVKSPRELLNHIVLLMDVGIRCLNPAHEVDRRDPAPWDSEVELFFERLGQLDAELESKEISQETMEQLIHGPVSDALTHVGQIAMLRRLSGSPVIPQRYLQARVKTGRVGIDQDIVIPEG